MKADSSGKSRVPSPNATGRRRFPLAKNWVGAVSGLSGGLEGDMPRKNDSESSEPLADGRDRRIAGTAMASPITRGAEKWRRVGERDGWGRLSVDGPGHYNPDRSEGPWGRAVKPLARRCHSCALNLDPERGLFRRQGGTKDGCKPRDAMIRRHQGRPPPIRRPWSRTGENPPYGILGRTMETSASFEARSAPSSHPTWGQRDLPESGINWSMLTYSPVPVGTWIPKREKNFPGLH